MALKFRDEPKGQLKDFEVIDRTLIRLPIEGKRYIVDRILAMSRLIGCVIDWTV